MSNDKKRQMTEELLDLARAACFATPSMIAQAAKLQIPARLIWCAAGAGLAAYHKSVGRVCEDIRAEFGADAGKLPQAYYDGYQLEYLRAEYQLA